MTLGNYSFKQKWILLLLLLLLLLLVVVVILIVVVGFVAVSVRI